MQRDGINYTETYDPVARYESIKVLLAIAAHKDCEMIQFDIKTAFLYGELDDIIFMKIPEGLTDLDRTSQVLLLKKALYGLKQALYRWHYRFKRFLEKFGFKYCESEWCIFVRICDNGLIMYLVIVVDDEIIFCQSIIEIQKIISALSEEFKAKISKVTDLYVGMQIV